jgi:hypothetical protein
MDITYKPWPHKLPMGVKAMYEVYLGDERIGVVKHTKVDVTRKYRQWNAQAGHSVSYTRRVRPLAWSANGMAGGPFNYYTRQAAAEALAEAHLARRERGR